MEALNYQNPYAVSWDHGYGQPIDASQGIRQQYDSSGPKTPPEYKGNQIPQIVANGQATQYMYPPYGSPNMVSQPLTPVLSSGSSQMSINMPGAASPALSNASSLPHSPIPQMGNYGQLGVPAPNGMQMAYSWDVYGNLTPLDQVNNDMGALQDAQQQASMQHMMNGYGMMPVMNGNMATVQPANPMNLPTNRTVYVGNLPGDASVDELLSQVRFGPIESVKILPEKSCAFISFMDPTIAAAFHSDIIMRKLQLHGQALKVGWGKQSIVPPAVWQAVHNQQASRNVYIGGLDPNYTEQQLRDDLSRFGFIDQVKIVRDRNIGFIHFLSIGTAMKVVATLPTEEAWAEKRISYGKDRCAYVPKNQHQQQAHNLAAAQMAATYTANLGQLSASINAMGLMNSTEGHPLLQAGNRTIYLGNLHPDTTVEEICNTIRGGILQQIRFIADKHICFVTFVDPNAALAFYTTSMQHGITIRQRRAKIGWGRPSGPPLAGIAMCVQAGGSRNVYIGGITDVDIFDEDRLRTDFGQYGEIEMVNILRDKNCGFVNFTDIANAIECIEGMKQHPEYSAFKIAYGKDRCGRIDPYFARGRRVGHPRSPHSARSGDDGSTSADTAGQSPEAAEAV